MLAFTYYTKTDGLTSSQQCPHVVLSYKLSCDILEGKGPYRLHLIKNSHFADEKTKGYKDYQNHSELGGGLGWESYLLMVGPVQHPFYHNIFSPLLSHIPLPINHVFKCSWKVYNVEIIIFFMQYQKRKTEMVLAFPRAYSRSGEGRTSIYWAHSMCQHWVTCFANIISFDLYKNPWWSVLLLHTPLFIWGNGGTQLASISLMWFPDFRSSTLFTGLPRCLYC